jgi:hypothetical protein
MSAWKVCSFAYGLWQLTKADLLFCSLKVKPPILAFFDTYLKGKQSALLKNPSPMFPEVAFSIHKPARRKS